MLYLEISRLSADLFFCGISKDLALEITASSTISLISNGCYNVEAEDKLKYIRERIEKIENN